ncbi:stalk domain-containing protein [Bacillus pinisoli]|uniref:stalk domain-containing protein n=1 Tax=Bacillus pinisoli TaxID=2901866 RepID=UPI001FF5390C|nr:stalk domain-containing protein [Bacillus pinisoli]
MKKLFILLTTIFLIATFGSSAEASSKNQIIIINKAVNQLAFYNNGKLVKTFPVATGKKRSYTPEGTFKIVNKIKNRPYYTGKVPGGDPRNPLGNRWLGLEARGTYGTTYGIHGNNNEATIGKYVSSGCVRMHNKDINWLFDQVHNHTKVVITHTNKSFDIIASSSGYKVEVIPVTKPVVKAPDYTPLGLDIFVNNNKVNFDQQPVLKSNRTLAPIRAIFEQLGASVHYDSTTRVITITKAETTIKLTMDKKEAIKNNEEVLLDVEPMIINNRTLLPVRFISESIGASVQHDAKKGIYITVN